MSEILYEIMTLIEASQKYAFASLHSMNQSKKIYYLILHKWTEKIIKDAICRLRIPIENPIAFYNQAKKRLKIHSTFKYKVDEIIYYLDHLGFYGAAECEDYICSVRLNVLYQKIMGTIHPEIITQLTQIIGNPIQFKKMPFCFVEGTNELTLINWIKENAKEIDILDGKLKWLKSQGKLSEVQYDIYVNQKEALYFYYESIISGSQKRLDKLTQRFIKNNPKTLDFYKINSNPINLNWINIEEFEKNFKSIISYLNEYEKTPDTLFDAWKNNEISFEQLDEKLCITESLEEQDLFEKAYEEYQRILEKEGNKIT